MTTILSEHLVQSVADALQFISYYHPRDYIQALGRAYDREQSLAAPFEPREQSRKLAPRDGRAEVRRGRVFEMMPLVDHEATIRRQHR